MKKDFKQVRNISVKCKRNLRTLTLASITFTFFSFSEANVSNDFYNNTKMEMPTLQPSLEPNGTLILNNNNLNQNMMFDAFTHFCHSNDKGKRLDSVYKFMSSKLGSFDFEKVSINGNAETGRLNMAFRLPDGYILSVTKLLDTMENNLVAFNILRKRQLIVSDVIKINLLSDYINKVQSRLG